MKTIFHSIIRPLAPGTPWIALAIQLGVSTQTLHAQKKWEADIGDRHGKWYDPGGWFDPNEKKNSYQAEGGWKDDKWDGMYRAEGRKHKAPSRTSSYQHHWNPDTRAWEKMDSSSQADATGFEGTIEGFRAMNLTTADGKSEEHSFVKVRLENGRDQVISLGTRINVPDLDLEKGKHISVSGTQDQVSGKDVLVANRIEVDGEVYRIREKNRIGGGSDMVALRGTVKDVREVSLRGSENKSLIARIETKSGRSVSADFGTDPSRTALNVKPGTAVRIEGERTEVDGAMLISARKVAIVDQKNNPVRESAGDSNNKPGNLETPARTTTTERRTGDNAGQSSGRSEDRNTNKPDNLETPARTTTTERRIGDNTGESSGRSEDRNTNKPDDIDSGTGNSVQDRKND